MAFFTIFVPPGLSEAEYRRALKAGRGYVSSRRREHPEMLRAAGFRDVDEVDLTAEFRETQQAWLEMRDRYAEQLMADEGEQTFGERRKESLARLAATDAGLLRRSLFVCS